MIPVLLIHGAFRGGWAWDRVRPLLEAEGRLVGAPDLPGSGAKWRAGAPAPSMDAYAGAVLDAAADLGRPIVVGHSQGGVVARMAVEAAPDRFAAIGYLDAPIPEDGLRAIDLQPPALADRVLPELDPALVLPPAPLEPGADLSADDAAWMNRLLTPQAVLPSLDPLGLADPRAAALPRHVAFCSATPETFPCWRTRAAMDESDEPYTVIDGSHDAPVTNPTDVAFWILGIGS